MSPRIFRSPVTCTSTNGDAFATRCCEANTLSRRPAAVDFFASPLCVHDTYAVLFLKRPTCLQRMFLVSMIPSNTSHYRSFPAISRQFIYKYPPWVCRSYQPSPKFIWTFQAPNFRFQCIFSWQPTVSNTLSRCIYTAHKLGVYHDQLLCCCCFMCSFLNQCSPVS